MKVKRCNHYWVHPQMVFNTGDGNTDSVTVVRVCAKCKLIQAADAENWRRLKPDEFGEVEKDNIRRHF